MKVLLDEDVPVRLRFYFQTAEVETVEYRGWKGLKNGALLRAAQEQLRRSGHDGQQSSRTTAAQAVQHRRRNPAYPQQNA